MNGCHTVINTFLHFCKEIAILTKASSVFLDMLLPVALKQDA